MRWFRLHVTLFDDPRVIRLSADAGASVDDVVMMVLKLYRWAVLHCESGEIQDLDKPVVQHATGCSVELFSKFGFIDGSQISDWEHIYTLPSKREREHGYRSKKRATPQQHHSNTTEAPEQNPRGVLEERREEERKGQEIPQPTPHTSPSETSVSSPGVKKKREPQKTYDSTKEVVLSENLFDRMVSIYSDVPESVMESIFDKQETIYLARTNKRTKMGVVKWVSHFVGNEVMRWRQRPKEAFSRESDTQPSTSEAKSILWALARKGEVS